MAQRLSPQTPTPVTLQYNMSHVSPAPLTNARTAAIALVALATLAVPASAQTNFAFFIGAAALESDLGSGASLGASVGLITKFNVLELLRLRGQLYVDKVQIDEIQADAQVGGQSVTMVSLGFGTEFAVGGRDLDVFVNATPHGTIRTSFRTEMQGDSSIHIANITRFSLGMVFGVGFEWFITDNIGLELQAQYDIYNFDHDETDPIYRAFRGFGGVQFYLGRNFAR